MDKFSILLLFVLAIDARNLRGRNNKNKNNKKNNDSSGSVNLIGQRRGYGPGRFGASVGVKRPIEDPSSLAGYGYKKPMRPREPPVFNEDESNVVPVQGLAKLLNKPEWGRPIGATLSVGKSEESHGIGHTKWNSDVGAKPVLNKPYWKPPMHKPVYRPNNRDLSKESIDVGINDDSDIGANSKNISGQIGAKPDAVSIEVGAKPEAGSKPIYGETKPYWSKPVQKPSGHPEVGAKPDSGSKPVYGETKPYWSKPVQKPSGHHYSKPSGQRPHGQRPNGQRPNGQRPNGQRPSGGRPHGNRPGGKQKPSRPSKGKRPSRPGKGKGPGKGQGGAEKDFCKILNTANDVIETHLPNISMDKSSKEFKIAFKMLKVVVAKSKYALKKPEKFKDCNDELTTFKGNMIKVKEFFMKMKRN